MTAFSQPVSQYYNMLSLICKYFTKTHQLKYLIQIEQYFVHILCNDWFIGLMVGFKLIPLVLIYNPCVTKNNKIILLSCFYIIQGIIYNRSIPQEQKSTREFFKKLEILKNYFWLYHHNYHRFNHCQYLISMISIQIFSHDYSFS